MPSLNLRLLDWQLDELRAQAGRDNRSIQNVIIRRLFPPEVWRDPPVAKQAVNARKAARAIDDLVTTAPKTQVLEPTDGVIRIPRGRRVRCPHRIPAGSFCKVCDV